MEVPELSFSGTLAVPYLTKFYDVSAYQTIHFMNFTDTLGTCTFNWSPDGINTDTQELVTLYTGAGIGNHRITPVRCRYLAMFYSITAYPAVIDTQSLFYKNDPMAMLGLLGNVGAGVKVLRETDYKIRSFISSDASISVTQNTDTIDVKSVSSGSIPIPLMAQASFSGGTYTTSGIGSGVFITPVFTVSSNNDKSGSPYIDTLITNGLKYIGSSSQIVQLTVTLSEEFSGAGLKQVNLRVYKNGVTILGEGQAEFDKRGWTSYTFQFSIATNDLIQLWADNLTDNVEMTIYQLIFAMTGTGY